MLMYIILFIPTIVAGIVGIGAAIGGVVVSNRIKKARQRGIAGLDDIRKKAAKDIDNILTKQQKILADNVTNVLTKQQKIFFENLDKQQVNLFANISCLAKEVDSYAEARIEQVNRATEERLEQIDKIIKDAILLSYQCLDAARQDFFLDVHEIIRDIDERTDAKIEKMANVMSKLPLTTNAPLILRELIRPTSRHTILFHYFGSDLKNKNNKLVIEGKAFEPYNRKAYRIDFEVPIHEIPSLAQQKTPLTEIKHIAVEQHFYEDKWIDKRHETLSQITFFPLICAVLELKINQRGTAITEEFVIPWHHDVVVDLKKILGNLYNDTVVDANIISYDNQRYTLEDNQEWHLPTLIGKKEGNKLIFSPKKQLILKK